MTYSANEYADLARSYELAGWENAEAGLMVLAALKIAAAVQSEGVLEAALSEAFDRRNIGSGNPAAAIRRALTGNQSKTDAFTTL